MRKYVAEHHRLPDILHAHSFVGGAAARYLSQKYGIPYVITEHYDGFISGNIPAHWQVALKKIYQDAAQVIAVSPQLAQVLQHYRKDITIIPNLINTAAFYSSGGETGKREWTIITVGALETRKNHSLLLRTVAELIKQLPLKLTIIGNGPLLKDLQGLADNLGISNEVTFTGDQLPASVGEYLRAAHLYVSTSTSESFALAPVEALACGVPVVMLRCGSILERKNYRAVRIVESGSDLKQAIVAGLKKGFKEEAIQISEEIRRQFSPELIADMTREVYRKL